MKKYLALIRAEWLDALHSRGEIVVWFILDLIPVFIMGSLWIASQNKILAIDTRSLVTYYILVLVITRLTEFYFDESIQLQIKDGTFSKYLLKPIRFPFALIPQNIGGKIFNTTFILLPALTAIIFLFKDYFIVSSPQIIALFILSLFISYSIQYSISVLVAATGFFLEESTAFVHLKWMLGIVAGGYALPLTLYPDWAQKIINLLPFKFIYYVPAAIYTNQLSFSQIPRSLAIAVIWSIFLLIISKLIWNQGLKKYSSVGG